MGRIKELELSLSQKETMLVKCPNDLITATSKAVILDKKLKKQKFCYQQRKKDDQKHLFYARIKNEAFENILNNPKFKVELVLIKLRLGLTNKDLAYHFELSFSVVSKIYRA